MFLEQLINGLTAGGIYGLIAVGYTMVYGVLGLINFAHGEVYMLSAFISFTLLNEGIPFIIVFPITIVITSAIGILIEAIGYRPLRKAHRLAPLITAIGISLFLQNLARIIWGARTKRFPDDAIFQFFYNEAFSIGDASITYLKLTIIGVTILAMAILDFIVFKTRLGMAMRAISQDKTTAGMMGIPINTVISQTFAIGSAMAGVAGMIVASYYHAIYPTMGYVAGIKGFACAVLGGIGNIQGAMLGGFIIGIAETFATGYISSKYSLGIAYLIMVLFIIFRPQGLFGEKSLK